jgi:hypothetical protein
VGGIADSCTPNVTCGNTRYAITGHPEYDITGKTIFATWTDANNIYGVRIEWQ